MAVFDWDRMQRVPPFVLGAMLAVASCTTAKYLSATVPPDWPSRVASKEECAEVSGVFDDLLLSSPTNPDEPVRLSNIPGTLSSFLLLDVGPVEKVDRVTLRLDSASTLQVTASRGADVVKTRTLSRDADAFTCGEGKLIVFTSGTSWGELHREVLKSELSLERLEDGTLLLHRYVKAKAIAFPAIPYGAQYELWYRAKAWSTE
jgi:hypothetical protein